MFLEKETTTCSVAPAHFLGLGSLPFAYSQTNGPVWMPNTDAEGGWR